METIARAQESRGAILDFLRAELVGPADGEFEEIRDIPYRRYSVGILYPIGNSAAASDDGAPEDNERGIGAPVGSNRTEGEDDPRLDGTRQALPSTIGLSFFLGGEPSFTVEVSGARYEPDVPVDTSDGASTTHRISLWRRIPKRWNKKIRSTGERQVSVYEDLECGVTDTRLRVQLMWRQTSKGHLVTVSLVNNERQNAKRVDPSKCFFQAQIVCWTESQSEFLPLPRSDSSLMDDEDQELAVLYRNKRIFATGHGCAAEWELHPGGNQAASVRTETLPSVEVPPVSYERPDLTQEFRLSFYADGIGTSSAPDHVVLEALSSFSASYREWVQDLFSQLEDLDFPMRDAAQRLVDRTDQAALRMEKGVRFLASDRNALTAFRLANRAMLLQKAFADSEKGARASATTFTMPNLEDWSDYGWRPFQLAFQLLTIESLSEGEHEDRKLVDLLWFPTGGGKTEAYLALVAYLSFYRRLRHESSGAGVAVIMRYTLRLLTLQQFERAARLIAACELIRRMDRRLGSDEISIGLWIGGTTTPNRFSDAEKRHREMRDKARPVSYLQLSNCPACGRRLIPETHNDDDMAYGAIAEELSHKIFCPNAECPFHSSLPVKVVDDELYQRPPTLLLATVDKFAQLPWLDGPSAFFGQGKCRPPDLILQDELHLIAGPLGSIVGLYEAAVEGLVLQKGMIQSAPPKIVCSTATIRQSDEQVRSLFARPVALFPPSGLDAGDSWFARVDQTKPGRMYVGVMPQVLSWSTAYIHVAAVLLQAPLKLFGETSDRDEYWTTVSYFNNLRDLGKAKTFSADGLPDRIRAIAGPEVPPRAILGRTQELTSNVKSEELPELLQALNHERGERDAISLLLCSNMLSVGVDVPRLSLMLVSGQPKTTSEYIQATSRVGRSHVPGLVVCLYSAFQPRDRSHYEQFRAYHEALYRAVEPTSLTPFTKQSRDRALHAVLVSLLRHGSGLVDPSAIRHHRDDCEIWVEHIVERVRVAEPDEAANVELQLRAILDEWDMRCTETSLSYRSRNRAVPALLKSFGEKQKGWPTLTSMRFVERQCRVGLIDHD